MLVLFHISINAHCWYIILFLSTSNSSIKYYCAFYIKLLHCTSNAIHLIECAIILGDFMDRFTMFP